MGSEMCIRDRYYLIYFLEIDSKCLIKINVSDPSTVYEPYIEIDTKLDGQVQNSHACAIVYVLQRQQTLPLLKIGVTIAGLIFLVIRASCAENLRNIFFTTQQKASLLSIDYNAATGAQTLLFKKHVNVMFFTLTASHVYR